MKRKKNEIDKYRIQIIQFIELYYLLESIKNMEDENKSVSLIEWMKITYKK